MESRHTTPSHGGESGASREVLFPTANPYVGPRTFEEREADRFFGREREARDLLSLVLSERLVLFYAQTGAGKSSLINARLRPGLRELGFGLLPTGRVSGTLPEGVEQVENIYAYNLMAALDEETHRPQELARLNFDDYLVDRLALGNQIATSQGESRRWLLVIDQFEEILTANPERWQEREPFFEALNRTMSRIPNLWIVLALREDYVASLDPFARLLPGRLRVRFNMERLGQGAALEAIRMPASEAGRPFAAGVAESLVRDLSLIRVESGSGDRHEGQYVEPVQLQVVCRRLWDRLKDRPPGEITRSDLDELGNVDEALGDFYDGVIAEAVQGASDYSETDLRTWIEEQLITEAETRDQVFRGSETTGGIDNAIVDALAGRLLLRAQVKTGGTWYELVHDRFVPAILKANSRYFGNAPIMKQAQEWLNVYRAEEQLLTESQLEALQGEELERLGPAVQELIQISQAHIDEQKRRRERTVRIVAFGIVALLVGLTGWALTSSFSASTNAILASTAEAQARSQANSAATSEAIARQEASLAAQAEATAEAEASAANQAREEAERQARRARAGELSVQAQNALAADDYLAALALADQAILATWDADGTVLPEAESVLRHAIREAPPLIMTLPRNRHQGRIRNVALSADGTLLASAADDGTARLWSTELGTQLALLDDEATVPNRVALSPDGSLAATGGDGRDVVIWNTADGQKLATLQGHSSSILDLAFSPDGGTLASASADETVRLWEMRNWREIERFEGHNAGVRSVAFSPVGDRIASGDENGNAVIWQPGRQGRIVLSDHRGWVYDIAFSPDGRRLSTGSSDGGVRLWNVSSGQLLHTYLGSQDWVRSVAFSPDGEVLVSASGEGLIVPWQAQEPFRRLGSFRGDADRVDAVAFAPDGTLFAGGEDPVIRRWSLDGELLQTIPAGHVGAVSSVAFSPDGSRVVSGGEDGTVQIWELDDPLATPIVFSGHAGSVQSVAFSPDGLFVVSGSEDRTLRLWSEELAADEPFILEGHAAGIVDLSFGLESDRLASASADGTLRFWDLRDAERLPLTYEGIGEPFFSTALSPDNRLLAGGAETGAIQIWDLARSNSAPAVLRGHESTVVSLDFDPEGRRLVSGSRDGKVYLWNLTAGAGPLIFNAQDEWLTTVLFSPDGAHIATAGDRAIRLWDSSNGAEISAIDDPPGRTRSIAFSPDGSILVSAGDDGVLRLWNLDAPQDREPLGQVQNAFAVGPHGDTIAVTGRGGIEIVEIGTGRRTASLGTPLADQAIFSPDGARLAAVDGERIDIWSIADERQIATIPVDGFLESLVFDASGQRVLVSAVEQLTRALNPETLLTLWDVNQGAIGQFRVEERNSTIRALAIAPDGPMIAGGDQVGRIWIWMTEGRGDPRLLAGHTDQILSLAFSPDGARLLSTSADGSALLWDVDTGSEIFRLEGHGDWIPSADFAANGERIATVGYDGKVRIWDAATGSEQARLEGEEGRLLSVNYIPGESALLVQDESGTIWRWIAGIPELLDLSAQKQESLHQR